MDQVLKVFNLNFPFLCFKVILGNVNVSLLDIIDRLT